MSNDSAGETKEPWMAHLYQEFTYCEKGTVEHDIASIIQDMLLSNNDDPACMAAHQIDNYYWDRNLDSRPPFQFQKGDDAFPDVISVVYTVILDLAPLLHYNDAKQDMLIQLLLELRKIPPRPVKAWNGDRLVDPDDTLFADLFDHATRGDFEWESYHQQLENFAAFLARCIAARVDSHIDIGKYPEFAMSDALEEDNPPGIKRNTRVTIAAQYILLAGSVIHEEIVQKMANEGSSWGLNKWQLWAEKFKMVTKQDLDPDVKGKAIEARERMISLCPELFPASDGGSKADH